MKSEEWIIWICFTFCVALMVGGILLLFRLRKKTKKAGVDYLQYYIIPIYTYGFYALWSQVFIERIAFFNSYPNIVFIREVISVMGIPFLVVGVLLQLFWVYRCLNKSLLVRLGIFILPLIFIGLSVIIFRDYWQINGPELSRSLSLSIIGLAFAAALLMLFGKSFVLTSKSRYMLSFLILAAGLSHIGNLFPIAAHAYYLPVYVFVFFLFNTLTEAVFVYMVKIDVPDDIPSFDEFITRYGITNRESEIIMEIYKGKSNREIAESQYVTIQTIKDHASRIYLKTEVNSRSQLIALLRNYL